MHGDEDDRMILVSVVIIDCVKFNMYIGCAQHTFFRSQRATPTPRQGRMLLLAAAGGCNLRR